MRIVEAGGSVFRLRFLADSQRLLVGTAGRDGAAHFDVLSLPDGGCVRLSSPPLTFEHPSQARYDCNALAVHPAGDRVFLAWHGHVRAFRTSDGAELPVPVRVEAHQVVVSPGGDRLLAADVTHGHKRLCASQPGRGPAQPYGSGTCRNSSTTWPGSSRTGSGSSPSNTG